MLTNLEILAVWASSSVDGNPVARCKLAIKGYIIYLCHSVDRWVDLESGKEAVGCDISTGLGRLKGDEMTGQAGKGQKGHNWQRDYTK